MVKFDRQFDLAKSIRPDPFFEYIVSKREEVVEYLELGVWKKKISKSKTLVS